MFHLGPLPVHEGRNSTAWWAAEPSGTAVLFVHGFGGSSVGTWSEFEQRLPSEAPTADLLFYGYDGIRTQAQTSAIRLRQLINNWMSAPDLFVNGTLPPRLHRSGQLAYQRLVIVAHSLGAVVARKALLDAFRSNSPWLQYVRLALFAPAHRGASVQDLVKATLGGWAWFKAALGLAQHATVLQDLDPERPFLRALVEDTQRALVEPGGATLRAQVVAIAPHDRIVYNVDFAVDDAVAVVIENTNHTSICKPCHGQLEALDLVRKLL